VESRRYFLQLLVRTSVESWVLGSPAMLIVLDQSF
jgi:hypothetical protein